MNKQIIHFGQDLNKAEFYNLIVKVSDINSTELFNEIRDELLQHGFIIYHFDEHTIEANFKHKYLEVLNKYRELDKEKWKYQVI